MPNAASVAAKRPARQAMVKKAVLSPAVKEQLAHQGVDAMSSEPEAVRETMVGYIVKWTALVKAANIRID